MFKTVLLALVVSAAALAPARQPMKLQQKAAVAGAAFTTAASNVGMALAGGQSEGTGLVFGIDDGRETTVLSLVFGAFFVLYFNWAKDQPDSDSDFFGEYDERRK